ncbi:MAG: formiminoglutamase [Patiriisocius sp.]|jgi:formiminoglutamase
MTHLKRYTKEDLQKFTNPRVMELKFGEAVSLLKAGEELKDIPQKYVLVGIPEDVGVRANYGRAGAAGAWNACLHSLCNMQQSERTKAHDLIILGEIDCRLEMEAAAKMQGTSSEILESLGKLVTRIDVKVSEVIETIVSAGKTPIIIGGGHNNSYGNLKGTSRALGKPINCLNFDVHSDFRPLEHRHSGNGFSYAKEEEYLGNYFIFGLQAAFASQNQLDNLNDNKETVQYSFFKNTNLFGNSQRQKELDRAEDFITKDSFGLEIDLDAIAMMGSSAMSPSGASVDECREFVRYFSVFKNCKYIHLCEAAPNFELFPNQVGKTLGYFVLDVING